MDVPTSDIGRRRSALALIACLAMAGCAAESSCEVHSSEIHAVEAAMAHSWTLLETMDAERFLAFSQSNRDRLRMFGFKLTSCRSAIARDERVTIPDGVDLAALRTGVSALDMVLYIGRDIETLEWTEEPRGDWVMRATLLRLAQHDLQEAGLNPGEPSVELQQRYHEISGSQLPEI